LKVGICALNPCPQTAGTRRSSSMPMPQPCFLLWFELRVAEFGLAVAAQEDAEHDPVQPPRRDDLPARD
jgi:hypothetical protein